MARRSHRVERCCPRRRHGHRRDNHRLHVQDMGLEQPKVPVVLSVADTIKLEYDFLHPSAESP